MTKNFLFLLMALVISSAAHAEQCTWDQKGLTGMPSPAGAPTDVTLRLYLNDIIAIHDAEQSFIADVLFRADWHDARLAHPAPLPCSAEAGQIWTPVLQLLNRREIERIREPQIAVAPDGTVTFLIRSYGEFTFRADLSDFPFDTQELSFNIVSTYGREHVNLVTGPELVGITEEPSVANWRISRAESRSTTEYIQPVDKHLARLDIVFDAERLTGYYTWQQLLPLFLVVMMTWVVFWIPQEYVPPRVGLAATSMLTLIAYRFAMSSVLPPIAYLTRLDIFIIGASVLVFAGLAASVAVSYIHEHHNEALADKVNRSARWMSPLLLVLVTAGAFFS